MLATLIKSAWFAAHSILLLTLHQPPTGVTDSTNIIYWHYTLPLSLSLSLTTHYNALRTVGSERNTQSTQLSLTGECELSVLSRLFILAYLYSTVIQNLIRRFNEWKATVDKLMERQPSVPAFHIHLNDESNKVKAGCSMQTDEVCLFLSFHSFSVSWVMCVFN